MCTYRPPPSAVGRDRESEPQSETAKKHRGPLERAMAAKHSERAPPRAAPRRALGNSRRMESWSCHGGARLLGGGTSRASRPWKDRRTASPSRGYASGGVANATRWSLVQQEDREFFTSCPGATRDPGPCLQGLQVSAGSPEDISLWQWSLDL
ncbi:PREDICTED: uncharacterized protein LOC105561840 [Vollenhovia emeryi]|uniref:uncharacterized protein LOC105561840 n=1 Tax=Vollenhovia emeryi TaxID=411798 RepID=UPI0005F507AD|nr:PREDICTED: uncharacterized protein LOC105561840 [Vollenhovia emeryi]